MNLTFSSKNSRSSSTSGSRPGSSTAPRPSSSRRRSENERQAEKAGTGLTAKLYEIKPVKVDRASYSWLYAAITDQLENGRFKDSVEDEVRKEMAAHRADAADQRREQLRDDAAENSTRNRA